MDTATERTALESKQREVEAFVASPITIELLADLKEQQELAVKELCDHEIIDVATFFRHVTMIGHLRGIRRVPGLIEDKLDEIKAKLKELNEDER